MVTWSPSMKAGIVIQKKGRHLLSLSSSLSKSHLIVDQRACGILGYQSVEVDERRHLNHPFSMRGETSMGEQDGRECK